MIRKLAHLCFVTTEFDRLVAFYRDILGLPVKFTFTLPEDGATFGCYLDCGDSTFIEIFDRDLSAKMWGGGAAPAELLAGNRYTHFCLEVQDLEALRTELVARGLDVTEVKQGIDHSFQAWTKDPDGNAIELMQYTGASLQLAR